MSFSATTSYFFRTAMGSMVRSPFVHVIAVAALSLSLMGYGLARVASGQLDSLVDTLGGDVELTVYLTDDATEAQVTQLEEALKARTGGAAKRVSPAEALGRLSKELGEQGRALTSLEHNPLPWTVEVKLPRAARQGEALAQLARSTAQLPFVSDVDYGAKALERLSVISRALRVGSLVAFALVFLTTVIIVSATLQLAIFARKDEIEIQKLVGATDRFVRVPFLIEGLLQGALAGVLAAAVVFALVRWLELDPTSALAFLRVDGRFAVAWPRLWGEQVGAGMLLGLLGSFVAVRRFLHV